MLTAIGFGFYAKKIKASGNAGEISLIGKGNAVGGNQRKKISRCQASRNQKDHFLCKKNKRDIEEIVPIYIQRHRFHFVDRVEEGS